MDMNYLIDFAYRNICFFNFLEISLNNWNIVTKENANEKISTKQNYFREKNDKNLINYQAEEKNCRLYTNECIQIKTDKILEWAKKSKIFLPKELKLEELNNFIDKTLYPTVFNRLVLLKNERNLILQLLFPQLLNNLLASFELLTDFKKEMLSKLKRENNNYNELFLKYKGDEEAFKKILKEKEIMQNKEKIQFEEKIKALNETIDKLKSQNSTQKNFNENDYNIFLEQYNELYNSNKQLNDSNINLAIENEFNTSDARTLRSENENLKKEIEKVQLNVENMSKKMESLYEDVKELKAFREENKKLNEENIKLNEENKKLNEEKIKRKKTGKAIINGISNYSKQIIELVKDAFDIDEEQEDN